MLGRRRRDLREERPTGADRVAAGGRRQTMERRLSRRSNFDARCEYHRPLLLLRVAVADTHADVARHHSVVRFVVLTFGLSVPFWILGAVVKTPESAPIPLPLSALQFVTPLVAASILVYRVDGYRGVRRLLRRLGDRGQASSWRKYALIVLVMPLTYAVGYLFMRASGRELPDPAISLGVAAAALVASATPEESGPRTTH
jgi:hypothetical protein